ncbi:MAG: SGNH/GDSL hydrolase family protein [Pirellulaceae bacterium]|nr:SGNH/GDSL hydrolase family protein [Pirellulaceae bacterium]
MNHSFDRRRLLGGSLIAAAATATISADRLHAAGEVKNSQPLTDGSVVLFQGDSITDAGRDRKNQQANNGRSFGRGYPMLIASGLLRDHASSNLKIFNRGISGNKVPDLEKRWDTDCIDLQPDLLSILIGVNDIWHKLNGRYDGTVADYETGLRKLLERTQESLPKCRIVICEPFVLRCGAINDKWFPEFDQRREACLNVARNMSLTIVPFQSMFDDAVKQAPPNYWAADGVHPTMAGHALMAKTWRGVVGV